MMGAVMFFVSSTILMLYVTGMSAIVASNALLPLIAFLCFAWSGRCLQKYCGFQYLSVMTGGPEYTTKLKNAVKRSQLSDKQRNEVYKSFGLGTGLYFLWVALHFI